MNRKLLFLLVAVFAAAAGWYYLAHPPGAKVKIGTHEITVDLAVTRAEKEQGLGGRTTLGQNAGMLFVYDHKELFEFWMRGMLFPLDFIWIDGERVADITLNVPHPEAGEQPVVVKPKVAVDKILELNAGTVGRLGIAIGDTVVFLAR